MKYKYYPEKGYLQGLPAQDLEDAELTDEQKTLLDAAVALGMYESVTEKPAPIFSTGKKKEAKNVEE